MAPQPKNSQTLSRFVAAAGADKLTGRLDINGGQATLFFFGGRPVHAEVRAAGKKLILGAEAIEIIVAEYSAPERVVFSAAEIPAYTIELTVEELVGRLGSPGGPPALSGPPVPGGPGYIPLLPRGKPLFDNIPLDAVVLEALAPALRDGAITVSTGNSMGVVLVSDSALTETYFFSPDPPLFGQPALSRIRGLNSASVSAYTLNPALVDCAPTLLRGEPLYQDMHLPWIQWEAFIADMQTRPGMLVIEVITPRGRGVTCLSDGKHIATYTDGHPALGDLDLLKEYVEQPEGTIYVRTDPGPLPEVRPDGSLQHPSPGAASMPPATEGMAPAQFAPPQAPGAGPSGPPAAAPLTAPQETVGSQIWPTTAPSPGNPSSPPPPLMPPVTPPAQAGTDPFAAAAPGATPPMVDFSAGAPSFPPAAPASAGGPTGPGMAPAAPSEVAPWMAGSPEPAFPPAGTASPATGGGMATLRDLLPEFKQIARARLQRSASRVEDLLEESAQQNRPVEAVLGDVRSMTIRGVMPSTLEAVSEEMSQVARRQGAI